MATRPKRRFVSKNNQEQLLQDFYDNLDADDDTFLGHHFVDSDGDFSDDDSDYDNGGVDDDEEIPDDVEIEPNAEGADEAIEEPETIDEPLPVERPKKQKFKSLDEVLDDDKYIDLPNQESRVFKYTDAKKTMVINWETDGNQNFLRQRGTANIVKNKPGPRGIAKRAQTPIDSFNLFFTDKMIEKIVTHTNDVIETAMERFADLLEESDKYPHFRKVDKMDISAFIGLLYLRAAFRLNLQETLEIWNHESAHDIFAATMSYNRFQFIRRFITFDDKSTRGDRWKSDKFACLRELFEMMNEQNSKRRFPSPLLAVDETLYPYHGSIGFKQYNPSKPAKYGLLYRSLCDSSVSYTYYTLPYAGKPEENTGEPGKYYVTGTDEYTKYLVTEFNRFNSIMGCNISMDRYFTSVTLAEWALDEKFTIVGTMRHDRKGIPKEMKSLNDREEKSTIYAHHSNKEIMLVSYIDKKKSGKKNIISLTTMHDKIKVTNDQRSKPQVLVMYDHTKGGVDVVDLISCHHSTRMKSKRWPLTGFAFMLDTIRTNSKTILQDNKKEYSNFEFTYQLGKALVMPKIQHRLENSNGLQIQILQKMRRVLGLPEVNVRPITNPGIAASGRCQKCVEAIVGKKNYKQDREKLNNKLKTKCHVCSCFLCKKHQYMHEVICESCFE